MLTNGKGKLAYHERYIPAPSKGARFNNPEGVNLGDCLLYLSGDSLMTNRLLVVEGAADALAAYESGYDVVSILGSNFTAERGETLAMLIRNNEYTKVVFLPDSDKAGIEAVPRITAHIPKIIVRWLPHGRKDLCTLTKEERDQFLAGVW